MLKVRMIWDVDCVLADMIPAICTTVKQKYNLDLTPQQIDKWDLKKVTGIQTISDIFDIKMLSTLQPIKPSLQYLQQIWSKTYSVLATYSMNGTYCAKCEWVKKYYPFINVDSQLIFIKKKYLLDGDILVDDSKANCIKWLQRHPNGIAIMLAYKYNELEQGLIDGHRLFRVKNWSELIKTVDMFINFANGCQNYITPSTVE